jgi:hypothetical protein
VRNKEQEKEPGTEAQEKEPGIEAQEKETGIHSFLAQGQDILAQVQVRKPQSGRCSPRRCRRPYGNECRRRQHACECDDAFVSCHSRRNCLRIGSRRPIRPIGS